MDLMGLRIMVTGGAGFVGSHLVDRLVELGNHTIVYDNFDEYYTGKEKNIKRHFSNPNFTLIKADILDYHILCKAMTKVDVVFHLAAQAGVRYSQNNPLKTNTINTTGTLNILKAAGERRVKKIVFASSSSVYGTPQYLPVDEKHPLNPISIYAVSKLAAEKYCQIVNDLQNLPVTILRYYTVYGPRQRPDMVIHKWLQRLLKHKPPIIYGDGKQTRDFTYIDDIVNGTLKAAETEEAEGEIFNLGTESRTSLNDLVTLLLKLTHKEDIIPVYEARKPSDIQDTYANISKARKILGYDPKVNLDLGTRRFLKWLVSCAGG